MYDECATNKTEITVPNGWFYLHYSPFPFPMIHTFLSLSCVTLQMSHWLYWQKKSRYIYVPGEWSFLMNLKHCPPLKLTSQILLCYSWFYSSHFWTAPNRLLYIYHTQLTRMSVVATKTYEESCRNRQIIHLVQHSRSISGQSNASGKLTSNNYLQHLTFSVWLLRFHLTVLTITLSSMNLSNHFHFLKKCHISK